MCRNRAIHYRIAERGTVAERIARTAAWQLAFHVMRAGVLWAGGGGRNSTELWPFILQRKLIVMVGGIG